MFSPTGGGHLYLKSLNGCSIGSVYGPSVFYRDYHQGLRNNDRKDLCKAFYDHWGFAKKEKGSSCLIL